MMLDTNICIFAMKENVLVQGKFSAFAPKELWISSVVLSELEHGVANSRNKAKSRARLDEFLHLVEVRSYDRKCAVHFGEIRTFLRTRGITISPMDTLIAAHALAENRTLVTNNTREFVRVPGLQLEDWAI